MPKPLIIYFDGDCNLCSGSVQFVLKRDHREVFSFASLQGVNGQILLSSSNFSGEHFKTFILQEGERLYMRSDAALRIAKWLGGFWSLLYVFNIVPRFIRDGVYNFISKNRYNWFGKRETCWIPQTKWQKRFLP